MVARIVRRALSTISRRRSYIDEWHATTVKPDSFYEEQAAPGLRRKKYFYSVDLQGRVFLEETLPKNLATSIKNTQFLDFFFQRMRRVKPAEDDMLRLLHVDGDYPFVSPCGPELNFVRPADSVIVFHTLLSNSDSDLQDFDSSHLVFGGSLTQPFNPQKVCISQRTGRLYHELVSSCSPSANKQQTAVDDDTTKRMKRLSPLHDLPVPEYGLIKSAVAVALSDNIVFCSERDATGSHSDMDFVASRNENYPISWLPEHAEPGPWSMPFVEDEITE